MPAATPADAADILEITEERLEEHLPDYVRDCSLCSQAVDETGTMEVRATSLNSNATAQDILLKCRRCKQTRKHGFAPWDDPAAFDEECEAWRDAAGRTSIDVVQHTDPPTDQLRALGYLP